MKLVNLQQSAPLLPLRLMLAFAAALFCFACSGQRQDPEINSAEDQPIVIPTPNIDLSKPLKISDSPDDVLRCENAGRSIDSSEFSNANWGIFVVSLDDGRIVCARDAQKLFNPASVQKILTSIVAFDKLGADFRWKTSVFSKEKAENGILDGDLTIYGTGAPDLDEKSVEKLISQLKSKGLRRIKGDIVGDDSYFKGDALGDGWAWNETQWYYGAAASALSINKNQAKLSLQNRKPRSSTDFVDVSGEANAVEDIEALGVKKELGRNKVYVWGSGNNLDARIAVEDPALWTASIVKKALEKDGIKVDGAARSADWRSNDKLYIENSNEIASIESASLSEIGKSMNKDSVNLYAELILRTLGKKFGESAPDENPAMQKLRGDDLAGAAVVKQWISDNKIGSGEVKIHDGSGLSRLDLVTPETIGRALVFASQSKFADEFKNSLPVAGMDGTLRGRLGNLRGRIIAKTGSIRYVNALAGFAGSEKASIAFVVLCNNATGKSDSSVVIDEIVEIFAK